MESQYNRDLNNELFYQLRWYHYSPNPFLFDADQIALAEKIGRAYKIPPGNALRLIGYAEKAIRWANKIDVTYSWDDYSEMRLFEEKPEPIQKIIFQGENRSFKISNPYLIDQLYQTMYGAMSSLGPRPDNRKKPRMGTLIKMIGTEIYRELMQAEKLSSWQSECILVQIFSLYKVGRKINEPLLTKEQHRIAQKERRAKGMTTEQYLTYCGGRGKNYHY